MAPSTDDHMQCNWLMWLLDDQRWEGGRVGGRELIMLTSHLLRLKNAAEVDTGVGGGGVQDVIMMLIF